MAGYRLRQSGEEVQGILDNAAMRAQLTAETERAQYAEQQLQTNIDNEAQARHQADTTLDGKIAAEKTRAEGAEGSLQTAINNEAQARQQADGVLDGKIAAEKTRAEGAEGSLQTAINNEAQARQQADGVLDGKIAAEKTRAEGAEQALQTAIDNEAKARRQTDGALDVSELNATENPHTLAKYVNLSAAIAAIPTDYQKGGMSIKFVQSSDNKYVQYRLMADSWSTDTDDWTIADEGVYVENPEFVRVVLDNEGKILEAVRVDGTKLLPAGVKINKKIDFEGNETTIIENPEFTEVKLDGAGHILWAIKTDGSIYYGAGVPQQVVDYINKKIAELSFDEYEDIVAFLNGLEEGDKTLQTLLNEKVDKEEDKSLIDAEYASTKSTIDNPEFLEVTTDSEDKVLEGIQKDGTKVIGGDFNVGGSAKILGEMEVAGTIYKVVKNPEFLAVWVDAEDKIVFGIKTDGKTYVGDADFLNDIEDIKAFIQNTTDKNIDWDALSSITTVENPEFIEAKTDSEGKVLAGRTPDGAAFENVGFSTPSLVVAGTDITDNIGAIESTTVISDTEDRIEIKTDKNGKVVSFRDKNGVLIEIIGIESPLWNGKSIAEIQTLDSRLPIINIISEYLTVDGDNIIGLNISKNEVECTVEYVSNEKRFTEDSCTIAYQGNSTLQDAKKGFSIVFPTKHRFKDWIEMDEYRLKGYGQDWTSGKDIIGNRLYGQVLATRNYSTNKPWKKYNDFSNSSIRKLMDTDKKCHMDGFPVELYINGSYWGVYVFEIRKERNNYNLDKKDNNHIQIEGEVMYADSRFTWNTVEIRNPKGYDEYEEPADGPVKTFITNWFNGISGITVNTTQIELEEYLDCQNFIDWYLHNAMICNHDVINKNTEFTTWDNKHITLIPQDLNGGWTQWAYDYDELSQKAYTYCSWLQTALTILDTPIKARYAELREKGIFTIENITKLWEDWGREIGTDAYDADQKRWNRQRDSFDTILQWTENRITYLDTRFDYNQN